MITIEDTSSLKVIVNVEEADILKIQEGMPATVSTDATGDEEIKGTDNTCGQSKKSVHQHKRYRYQYLKRLFCRDHDRQHRTSGWNECKSQKL